MTTTLQYSRLSDRDLLAQFIGVSEAEQAYRGSLRHVFADNEQCVLAKELVQRLLSEEMQASDVLNSPVVVRDYLRLLLDGLEHEVFVVIFLDAQHRVIASEEMFRGTLSQTSVYPREVVKHALSHNAAAVILAHNHPSGALEPSHSDRALTDALKQSLALVDVRVLDHFVVGGSSIISFAERGLI